MKLSNRPPVYCSSCFGQYPDRKYVDFDAYWDGPTLNEENNITVAIDDLIICEICLGAAATLLGYVNEKEMIKENYELGKAVDVHTKELEARDKIISDQNHTIQEVLAGNVRRPSGRPVIRMPESVEVA